MAIELGSAYVTVIPEMNGVQASIGKALGDKSMGNKAGGLIGDGMSMGIASKLKTIAKLIAGLAATKAVIDFGRAALDSYAQYEQLVGGVDTLFKDASSQVQQFAADAYQTAGMSANQYMEAVTGFSASLIQSLDGDTAKAATLADQAIRDMSDNANKMGTDMESIQNAYQGFAKQNYTMLDNLKLGYGGTKEEMERLLADAEAISGVHYDISSYADVVDAIHVIQTEMGITGTTANEAASTIEGSVGMMRAAWANWVTGIADEDADMGELTQQLVDSVLTAASNVVPRIGVIARGMISTIPTLLQTALRSLPDLVRSIFGDAAADGLVEFMKPFMGLRLSFQAAVEPVQAAIAGMTERIQQHLADAQPYFDKLMESVSVFAESVGSFIEAAAPVVAEFLGNLVSGLVGLLPLFSEAARVVVELATAMLDLATSAITGLTESWSTLGSDTQAAWDSIKSAVSGAVDGLKSSVSARWEEIKSKVSSTVDNMRIAVTSKFNAIKSSVSGAVNGIKTTVSNAFSAVKTAMTTPIESAKTAISNAISSIKGIFSGLNLSLPHFALPHFNVSGGKFPWGVGGEGSPPHFSVDWYARGGFFDEPTVFLPGVGERGTELAWPSYEPYFTKYAQGIADAMPDKGSAAVVEWLDRNLAPVIWANVDHLSRRDFNRMAREAVRAGA